MIIKRIRITQSKPAQTRGKGLFVEKMKNLILNNDDNKNKIKEVSSQW
jgi:hypothetical protein